MFLGHFAVGFAAKRVAPRASLGTLFAAAQFLDLLWPPLILAGIETVQVAPGDTAYTPLRFTSYPWSHSLLLALAWSAIFALAYRARTGHSREALVVGALVASHWALDFASHRPDLPLAPGAAKVGLGLWDSIPATLAVEGALFALGVVLYVRGTRARSVAGRAGLWALIAVLLAIDAASLLGPPPPGPRAVGVAGLAVWLLVLWGAWVDRGRRAIS